MKKDLRKEQVSLLRFEKQLAALAAALAATKASAEAAQEKLNGTANDAYADMQASLLQLADVTSKAHDALNTQAIELGYLTFQVWGVPKKPPLAEVKSILGLG